jgi:hypothetical protein
MSFNFEGLAVGRVRLKNHGLRGVVFCCLLFGLNHCAFTEFGQRINDEQLVVARLEERRQKLETRYIIVLNNLESHPNEAQLLEEKDKVYRKLQSTIEEIGEKRKLLDQSFAEWEQKILEERIQLQMIDKEEKESAGRVIPEE